MLMDEKAGRRETADERRRARDPSSSPLSTSYFVYRLPVCRLPTLQLTMRVASAAVPATVAWMVVVPGARPAAVPEPSTVATCGFED